MVKKVKRKSDKEDDEEGDIDPSKLPDEDWAELPEGGEEEGDLNTTPPSQDLAGLDEGRTRS